MLEIIGFAIFISLGIFWFYFVRNSEKHGAPFVPLEPQIVEQVMLYAQIKPGDTFYDLGSGDGRIVIAAALRGANAYGVEIDKLRVLYARLWIFFLQLRQQAIILEQDLFTVDLSGADIVCLFLLQETNEKLEKKLEKELKPGTRVISVAFSFPNWEPLLIDPHGPKYGPIYVYQQ